MSYFKTGDLVRVIGPASYHAVQLVLSNVPDPEQINSDALVVVVGSSPLGYGRSVYFMFTDRRPSVVFASYPEDLFHVDDRKHS